MSGRARRWSLPIWPEPVAGVGEFEVAKGGENWVAIRGLTEFKTW